jgi:predicted ATPase
LLTNYRPEYRHEWGQKTYYTQLRLAPLGKEEAEELLTALLDEKGSPLPGRERDRVRVIDPSLQTLKRLILEKTEGTPFFMEEVVQTLVEDGTLSGAHGHYRLMHHVPTPHALTLHLPPTVQGILAARIDRLAAEEKAFLHQLAVIGRQFPLSLVRKVVPQSEDELYRLLSSLQNKEFLYEQPAFPEPDYIFKHALTQEVAYGTVLQDKRKALHERTAQAIESLYSAKLEDHYGELAHHYSHSGNTEKAIKYLHLAGQQAGERSAYLEAITHLTTALQLLDTLPDTLERNRQELILQTVLAPVVVFAKGFAVPEVEQIYLRARELCRQVGDSPQLFPVILGLRTFYHVQGKPQIARELAEQLVPLAQKAQEPALLVLAHRALGATLFILGELTAARSHLEQSILLYDSQRHRSDAVLYGQDPGVLGGGYLAWTLWHLGYPTQAQERGREALAVAQELARPASLATALANVLCVHLYLREEDLARERAEMAISLSIEQAIPTWNAVGAMGHGWVLAQQGQVEEGIDEMQQGLAAYRITGAELQRSFYLALLAEAYGKAGQTEEGLTVLAEALAMVDKTGERFYEAELYRLKGELSLQSRSPKSEVTNPQPPIPSTQAEVEREAEGYFQKAIEIARKQGAKSLELRATTSLVRLRQQQATQYASRNTQHETRAKLNAARNILSEIYNWFTEGFDTKDLQEAKALLAQLEEDC